MNIIRSYLLITSKSSRVKQVSWAMKAYTYRSFPLLQEWNSNIWISRFPVHLGYFNLYFSFQTTTSLDNAEEKIQIEKQMNTSGIGDINNRDKKLPDTIMNWVACWAKREVTPTKHWTNMITKVPSISTATNPDGVHFQPVYLWSLL